MLSNLTLMEAKRSLNAVLSVRAVITVDAIPRIPEELSKYTFFGEYDVWRYVPIFDKKLCHKCAYWATNVYFRGKYIRGLWKRLKIVDANTIEVWVHPNCRCILVRVTNWREYISVTTELYPWG